MSTTLIYNIETFYKIKTQYKIQNNNIDDIFNKLFNVRKQYFKPLITKLDKYKSEIIIFLNKISKSNVDVIIEKIIHIINECDILEFIIEKIFDLSTCHKDYCTYYVKIIREIILNIDDNKQSLIKEYIKTKIIEFKILLKSNKIKQKESLTYNEFCENNKLKIFKGGYSQFIGELFNNNIIDYVIIIDTIKILLIELQTNISNHIYIFIEDYIIGTVTIIKTINDSITLVDKKYIISQLEQVKNTQIPKRLIFKLMDITDLLNK